MKLRHPLTDLDETFTQLQRWLEAENALSKIFTSHKIWCVKITTNLRQFIEDGRQSKARNLETHQHVDKRLYGTKLGAITRRGLSETYRENYRRAAVRGNPTVYCYPSIVY